MPQNGEPRAQEGENVQKGVLPQPDNIRRLMRRWCELSWKREQQKRTRAHRVFMKVPWTGDDEGQEALLREEIRATEHLISRALAERDAERARAGSNADYF